MPPRAWVRRSIGVLVSACGLMIFAWTKDGMPSERIFFILACGMALAIWGVGITEKTTQKWGRLEWVGYWACAVLAATVAIAATGVPIYFLD